MRFVVVPALEGVRTIRLLRHGFTVDTVVTVAAAGNETVFGLVNYGILFPEARVHVYVRGDFAEAVGIEFVRPGILVVVPAYEFVAVLIEIAGNVVQHEAVDSNSAINVIVIVNIEAYRVDFRAIVLLYRIVRGVVPVVAFAGGRFRGVKVHEQALAA